MDNEVDIKNDEDKTEYTKQRFNVIHNNKYSYDKFVYTKAGDKVTITCPIHGDFEQSVSSHLSGHGCKRCAASAQPTKGTDKFIEQSKLKHGDKYNYDKTVYVDAKTKVLVTCPIHGDFLVLPNTHLKKDGGCKGCQVITLRKARSLTNEDFIKKATAVHGNKFNYSKTDYVNLVEDVIITCPIHGDFSQSPASHLRGGGCRKCSSNKLAKDRSKGVVDFIAQANIIHDHKYNYDKFIYSNNRTPSTITCPVHGDFEQDPSNHLSGKGCRKCSFKRISEKLRELGENNMSYAVWGVKGKKSKRFESYKVYITVCESDEESFIKVGRTYSTVKRRFETIPYKYSIHNTIVKEDPIEICKIEQELKTELKSYRYQPQKQFGGQFECFSIDALHSGAIDELIKNYN